MLFSPCSEPSSPLDFVISLTHRLCCRGAAMLYLSHKSSPCSWQSIPLQRDNHLASLKMKDYNQTRYNYRKMWPEDDNNPVQLSASCRPLFCAICY